MLVNKESINNKPIENISVETLNTTHKKQDDALLKPYQQEDVILSKLKDILERFHIPQDKTDAIFELYGGSLTEIQLKNLEELLATNCNKLTGKVDFDQIVEKIKLNSSKVDNTGSKPTLEELDKIIKETTKEELQNLYERALSWYDNNTLKQIFEKNGININDLSSDSAVTCLNELINTPQNESKNHDILIRSVQIMDDDSRVKIVERITQKQKAHYNTDTSQYTNEELEEFNSKSERFAECAADITIGIATSTNGDPSKKAALLKDISDSQKEYPTYKYYLESIANYVNSPNYSYDIAVDELKDILNAATNNEYSKIELSLPEKTATDEKTGGFKNNTTAYVQAASQKANEIKQIIADNTPQENKDFVVKKYEAKQDDTKSEKIPETESFFEKYSREFTENILTGKVKTYSSAEEAIAIDNYKRMDFAQQGKLLQASIGKFLKDLIDNTKTTTLENLLSIGWKGASFDITKQVENTVEDRKNKSGQNPLRS